MSLYKPSLDVMVESINRLNKLDLVASEYIFGAPTAITPVGQLNTMIKLTAKNQNSAYAGERELRYHRLSLGDLATQVALVVPLKEPTSTADVIASMNKRFGTVFTAQDILIRALTDDEKLEGAEIVLEALPTSMAWIGSVSVATRPGGYMLADYLKNTRLTGLYYPSPTTTRPYAHIYSYWRDMSTSYNAIKDIVVGNGQLTELAAILSFQTGDVWVTNGSARYSLAGATVTAVGNTADAPDATNVKYDRYVKVMLDDANSLGLTGEMTLHYNVPMSELP